MVASGSGNTVSFWNTKTFIKEHSVPCCNCSSFNGLIELPNHCIDVSGGSSSTIDIVDTEKYQRIKQIECKMYINSNNYVSSLYLLNNKTFVYSHKGSFCQISSTTYEVVFKYNKEGEFGGAAIISSSNGKFIIASNWNNGISIFRVNYI